MSMPSIAPIHCQEAPQAIGPYSQGVAVGQWLFFSGQIPLLPESGQLIAGDIAEQMRCVMENISALLTSAGVNWRHVVKSTLYLVDMNDFATVNEIYAHYLTPPYPARSTVAVAALPKGARVELEVVACLA
ncbi:RidA family protein [Candidatus Magnetaquicoccus inordinatus]|uniref:RidA family protein n=1 Tax=Candidatus Magnetaquicoccus inordinatus TaxID=2496818 RepID=UPI001D0E0E2B|nr:RidA family protein [Candidatus Magnetaquicoccus inordinatus]